VLSVDFRSRRSEYQKRLFIRHSQRNRKDLHQKLETVRTAVRQLLTGAVLVRCGAQRVSTVSAAASLSILLKCAWRTVDPPNYLQKSVFCVISDYTASIQIRIVATRPICLLCVVSSFPPQRVWSALNFQMFGSPVGRKSIGLKLFVCGRLGLNWLINLPIWQDSVTVTIRCRCHWQCYGDWTHCNWHRSTSSVRGFIQLQ
jgi:hypothetical protein